MNRTGCLRANIMSVFDPYTVLRTEQLTKKRTVPSLYISTDLERTRLRQP